MNFFVSQPPPPSSRPPLTEYKILHNTTGNNLTVMTEDTKYIIEYTTPGVYLFIVLAYNVLGDGNRTSIVVTG